MTVQGAATKPKSPLPPAATGSASASPPVSPQAMQRTLGSTGASLRRSSLLVGRFLARPEMLSQVLDPWALLGHVGRMLDTAQELATFAIRFGSQDTPQKDQTLQALRNEMARLERLQQAMERHLEQQDDRVREEHREQRLREARHQEEQSERLRQEQDAVEAGTRPGPGLQRRA